jgi:hypothetical protein
MKTKLLLLRGCLSTAAVVFPVSYIGPRQFGLQETFRPPKISCSIPPSATTTIPHPSKCELA